jgi:hypothetical protein
MTSDQESHFRLVLSKLVAFENGQLALSSLIPELEELFHAVGLDDEDWQEGFWDSWGDLEISYAFALNRGWKSLDEVGEQIVCQAVADLKSLIGAKLPQGSRNFAFRSLGSHVFLTPRLAAEIMGEILSRHDGRERRGYFKMSCSATTSFSVCSVVPTVMRR